MSTLRKIVTPIKADKMLMAVLSDTLLECINLPLRVRKAHLRVEYTTHMPTLFMCVPDDAPAPFMWLDTRKRVCYTKTPTFGPAGLIVDDIARRLKQIGASLTMNVDNPRNGARVCKLQAYSKDSRIICLTLADTRRGFTSDNLSNFEV